MRSLKLALGFLLLATAAAAQSYPSSTFNTVTAITSKTSNAPGISVQGVKSTVNDPTGWTGSGSNNFIEAGRFQSALTNGSTLGSAYGIVCSGGQNPGTTFTYLIGCEGEVINSSVDAPAPGSLNANHMAGSFLASSSGTKMVDYFYGTNPYTTSSAKAQSGLYIAANSINNSSVYDVGGGTYGVNIASNKAIAAFAYTYGASLIGLDLVGSTLSYAAIRIPNNISIRWQNAAANADLAAMYVDGSNNFVLGTSTNGTSMASILRMQKVVVSSLPTCNSGNSGGIQAVSDGTASLAWGATVTGGGSTYYTVNCNGTNWTVMGK